MMHHFSQKIVAITNALVFCLFILFALEKHQESEGKKPNHSTQNSKNGLDKIIGTFSKWYEIIVFQARYAPLICI